MSGKFPALAEGGKRNVQSGQTAKRLQRQNYDGEHRITNDQAGDVSLLYLRFRHQRTPQSPSIRASGSTLVIHAAASRVIVHSTCSPERKSLRSSFLTASFFPASTTAVNFAL